jgi:hypothetical protein
MGSDGRNLPNPRGRINENFTIFSNFRLKSRRADGKFGDFKTTQAQVRDQIQKDCRGGFRKFRGLHQRIFPTRSTAFPMLTLTPQKYHDGRLWMIALGLSLLANTGIVAILGFASLNSHIFEQKTKAPAPIPADTTVTIFPDIIAASQSAAQARPATASANKPRFARTSDDQTAPVPESAAFIGERNTRATSDRAANAAAPPLPSQSGIAPKDDTDIETTESRYQEGETASNPSEKPAAESPAPPEMAATAKQSNTPPLATSSPPPPGEKLLDGPNPVDVAIPKAAAANRDIKAPQENRIAAEPSPPPSQPKVPAPPTAKPSTTPEAKGFQRKTAMVGSISRTGRSALDVTDSPLGRYQAVISRAVEQEWQRNCVRHRDFITPGFLTVRFFVESNGHVRTVQFVGEMETGEVQKGFTLNAIRDAEIPSMPAAIKKDFAKEPLELIFNFYF